MPSNYICALDIGASKIAAVLAEIKAKRIDNIYFESVYSKGIKQGVIVDSVELVGCVSRLMNSLKLKSGVKIKFVYANISGPDMVTKHSRAVVPLTERGNKVITASDIRKADEQARILGSSLEEEIVHIIPCGYTLDSKSSVINPLGLYSHRLESDLYLVCARLSSVQSLMRAINQSGYEMKDLFFSGLATSRVVFNRQLREGANLFCDIGSDITELLLFKNGVLKDMEILPVGSSDLTLKMQEELKIPFELAEEIKRAYGVVGSSVQAAQEQEILVKKANIYKPIKQKLVSEIITSCVKQICSDIKTCVDKKVSSYEVNNFIVCGRTVLLEGFIEALENTLNIPVKLGRIINPDVPSSVREHSELSGQKYLTYLTALGMICEAMHVKTAGGSAAAVPAKNPAIRLVNKFKELYQEYF